MASSASADSKKLSLNVTETAAPPPEPNLDANDSLFTDEFVQAMTPRSQEACKLLGVLPGELVVKPFEAFFERGIDPEIQALRYRHYESGRKDTVKLVKNQRAELLRLGWQPSQKPPRIRSASVSPQRGGSPRSASPLSRSLTIQTPPPATAASTSTAASALSPPGTAGSVASAPRLGSDSRRGSRHSGSGSGGQGQASHSPLPSRPHTMATGGSLSLSGSQKLTSRGATSRSAGGVPTARAAESSPELAARRSLLLEMERIRIDRMMARQNKELEAVMSYELKMANAAQKLESTMDWKARREQELEQRRREEIKRQINKREMLRKQREEQEDADRQRRWEEEQRLMAEHVALKEEHRKREIERKEFLKERHLLRVKQKQEAEARIQELTNQQRQLIAEKEREMKERENQHRQRIEQTKQELLQKHQEKAALASVRIALVLEESERINDAKREKINKRLTEQEERAKEFERSKQESIQARVEMQRQLEEKRRKALEESQKLVGAFAETLTVKTRAFEESKAEIEKNRKSEQIRRAEVHRLNKIRKQANVERLKRMEAYKREQLKQKHQEEDQKAREMEHERRAMLQEREKNRILAKRQKEKMLRMFDQLRLTKNWDALSRLTQALAANSSATSRRESADGALANMSLAQVNELLGNLAASGAPGSDGNAAGNGNGGGGGGGGGANALANSASAGPAGSSSADSERERDIQVDYGHGGEEKHVFAWQRVWNNDKQPSAATTGSNDASDSERSKNGKDKDGAILPSYLSRVHTDQRPARSGSGGKRQQQTSISLAASASAPQLPSAVGASSSDKRSAR